MSVVYVDDSHESKPTETPPKKKKPFYRDLFFQVIVGVLAGILLGHFNPEFAVKMEPLGKGFINLIKMMIAPIIFCTIVTGVAGMGDMKQVGRVGVKSLIYFEVITTLALVLGMVIVHIYQPGSGLNISPDVGMIETVKTKAHSELTSTTDFFLNIIPHTMVSAFSEGEILQVLLVALLFAAGVTMMGEKGRPIVGFIDSLSHVIFNIIAIIIKLAPLGAFGAMAYSVGKFGVGSLVDLGQLMLVFFGTCIMFVTVVMGGIMHFYCRLSIWQFIKYIREELVIVFGTASSETVLPRMMDKLTAMGCSKPVVGMVIPTGYSFNLDGTSIYLTLAAMFIAYATQTEITLGHQITLLGVLLLTSKGAAGVYGSAFVVLAATLSSVKIFPEEALMVGLALLFAIDRFMATGRALTNLIGNGVATIVIAKWEKQLDHGRATAVLSGVAEPNIESDEDKDMLLK
jgi:aerobic C4-dicarboxylate transport protein